MATGSQGRSSKVPRTSPSKPITSGLLPLLGSRSLPYRQAGQRLLGDEILPRYHDYRRRWQVVADNTRASVAPGDITILRDADEQKAYERLLQPGWAEWPSAELGFAGTIGNARTSTFTTSVNAARHYQSRRSAPRLWRMASHRASGAGGRRL